MTDHHLFQEVDEEVRREQLQKLWEKYGVYFIGLALVVLVGIGGWRGYLWYQAKQAMETGGKFEAAATLADQGKTTEAAAAFDAIASQGTAGYRELARLRAAAAQAEQDQKAGLAAFEAIAADRSVSPVMREVATLRAGAILVDTAPYDEVRARLEPLTGPERTFRHTAREYLALAAWRANDRTALKRWADMIMADPQTPLSTRTRIEVLVALAGDGKVG